jgi:IS4 transposase
MENTLGFGNTEEFVSKEFASLDLRDRRLNERAKSIFVTLQGKLSSTIRRLFLDAKQARQAYDFFSNPKVSGDKLMDCHYKETVKRIKESDASYILAIQDQMRLNYTGHPAKTGLGSIGKAKKTEQYGLIQHSVLCVTDQNVPLGLMDVELFDYSEIETSLRRDKRAVEDKTTHYWIAAIKAMRERLGDIKQQIITVADREGDFYELLHALTKAGEEFVIRAKHNRVTGEKYRQNGTQLWTLLESAPVSGTMEVEIQDVNSREIKTIQLSLTAIEITLPVPKKISGEAFAASNYQAIKVNVVRAYNEEHEWVLLTSLPIDTIEQIQTIVTIYKQRWHIEDFHKVLKTGYQVDEIYLHSSRQAIENLLMLASISACRLYWLIYVGRTEPGIKADQLFEEFEWKAVYVFFKEDPPEVCPPLSNVILKIAQLGGYKASKHAAPPGIKTMWTGFQHFTIAAQMYRNMSTKT